ncbi:hypothetical protein HOI83_04695 [Candidatus Uhrbacteria bacterium]|jgi:hypothetical protein|nr:hypothetical protein [Candidatus Uhrbacteria bacterium]
MQITPGQRRSIVAALIVLILVMLFLLWFFLFRGGEVVPEPVPEPVAPEAVIRDTTPSASEVIPVTADAASARVVAMNFAERFGTYSTDVPFENVNEVKELSTPEYHATLQSGVTDVDAESFRGVSTRALSAALSSGSEESGSVVYAVAVQNEIELGTRTNTTIEYKTATISLEKRGELWLVANFQWN